MDTHTSSQLPIVLFQRYTALDSFYCGKWKKSESQDLTLTLFRQYPMLNSSE